MPINDLHRKVVDFNVNTIITTNYTDFCTAERTVRTFSGIKTLHHRNSAERIRMKCFNKSYRQIGIFVNYILINKRSVRIYRNYS